MVPGLRTLLALPRLRTLLSQPKLRTLLALPRLCLYLNAFRKHSKSVPAWLQNPVFVAGDKLPLNLIRIVYLAVCSLHLLPFKITRISDGSWELKQLTGVGKLYVVLLHFCMFLRAGYGARMLHRNDLCVWTEGGFTFDSCIILAIFMIRNIVCTFILVLYAEAKATTDLFNFGNQISEDIAG